MKVPIEESYRETGKGPVSTKRLDTNKGDSAHPNIRSRFVAREIAHERDTAMVAATPPLKANNCSTHWRPRRVYDITKEIGREACA